MNPIYIQNFIDGYAAFAMSFMLSIVIGCAMYIIKEVHRELKEFKKN